MSDVVRSAARVLDLLEYFAGQEHDVSLAAVSAAFALPKSSALGLLRTLHGRGYLIRDEQGGYRLNEYFRQHGFGWGGDKVARVCALADAIMKALAKEVGETVSMGMLTSTGHIKIVAQTLSEQAVRYESRIGHLFPVHCTAMGRVLLAKQTLAEREEILAKNPLTMMTPQTLTDKAQILEQMDLARQRGYCIVMDESDLGGTGVAMALLDTPGSPFVALNVSCVSSRFNEKREHVVMSLEAAGAKLLGLLKIDR